MKSSTVLFSLFSACGVAASVTGQAHRNRVRDGPEFDYDPSTTKYCTYWYDNEDGSTSCEDVPELWDISEQDWKRWNPTVAESCDNFVTGKSYCVEANDEPAVPKSSSAAGTQTVTSRSSTSTTTASTTKTEPDNGIATPTPTQPGMVSNCEKFYKVQSGDTCDKIVSQNGISVSEFTSWNAGIGGKACTGLWLDTYVCVSVIGSEAKPTPTKPDNGIATPTPFQPGMVDNCNEFYKVVKGDYCAGIASKNGVTTKDFTTWNPKVGGESCSGLWLDTYVCVSVIGHESGPLTQPGMAKDCKELYEAVSGDTCQKIVDEQGGGLTLAKFYEWNPAVKNDCTGLLSGYSYCVGLPSAFSVRATYHVDCTGKVHRETTLASGEEMCLDTNCEVASLDIAAAGDCPGGQVQISYWEQPGCQGKWFGYGYASRGQCRGLWTEGWKFKAVHLRCARQESDCVSQKACTFDPEPGRGVCM